MLENWNLRTAKKLLRLFLFHFSHTGNSAWGPRLASHVHGTEPERPPHLVGCCLLLLGALSVFLIISKHDQADEGAHAQGHLLAGEHGIAGAAGDRCQRTETTSADTTGHVPRDLQRAPQSGRAPRIPPRPLFLPGNPSRALASSSVSHPCTHSTAALSERELR